LAHAAEQVAPDGGAVFLSSGEERIRQVAQPTPWEGSPDLEVDGEEVEQDDPAPGVGVHEELADRPTVVQSQPVVDHYVGVGPAVLAPTPDLLDHVRVVAEVAHVNLLKATEGDP